MLWCQSAKCPHNFRVDFVFLASIEHNNCGLLQTQLNSAKCFRNCRWMQVWQRRVLKPLWLVEILKLEHTGNVTKEAWKPNLFTVLKMNFISFSNSYCAVSEEIEQIEPCFTVSVVSKVHEHSWPNSSFQFFMCGRGVVVIGPSHTDHDLLDLSLRNIDWL